MSVSRDNSIKILDSRMYLPINTCNASTFRIGTNWTKGCFSSDGTYVACGGVDGNVYIWQNGNLVSTLPKHTSGVCSVVWSSLGGARMYSISDKEKLLVEWGVQE
jgi:autophagy-related protein 16